MTPDSQPPAAKGLIHLSDLNLDSSGAFDATDAQARKVRLRFDSVNYVLRTAESTGKPQWSLTLFNKEDARRSAQCVWRRTMATSFPSTDAWPPTRCTGTHTQPRPSCPASNTPRPSSPPPGPRATVSAIDAHDGNPRHDHHDNRRHSSSARSSTPVHHHRRWRRSPIRKPWRKPPPTMAKAWSIYPYGPHARPNEPHRGEHARPDGSDRVKSTLQRTGSRVQRFFTGHGASDRRRHTVTAAAVTSHAPRSKLPRGLKAHASGGLVSPPDKRCAPCRCRRSTFAT